MPYLFAEPALPADAEEGARGLQHLRHGDGLRSGREHDRGSAIVPHQELEPHLLGTGGNDGIPRAEDGVLAWFRAPPRAL